MVVAISANHFKQIKTVLANVYFYLDEVAELSQEAAEHLAEVEEALSTLQSVEVGSRGCQLIIEGITQSRSEMSNRTESYAKARILP